MPRIAAASIDEHVRIQNERIRVAARQLFSRQGFTATDMGQIASAMGLARNSLYRYYSNKDHILLACIREDMEPHLQQLESLAVAMPRIVQSYQTGTKEACPRKEKILYQQMLME